MGVNALYLVDATIQKFYGKDYVLRCGLTAIILRIEILLEYINRQFILYQ
ncbi:hypothetical protein F9B77_03080 [Staphylococcus epidermidis]|uniref:Uncharacterized protein n=2 Tax=Staphylococcus epidermidis TaxID=1282 RepID=A0A0H2VEX1_STAES|nr:hypothetical protein SE_0417 [Staphylococcus epidermidis ATCC 12228]AXE42282.1 hypothetical protein DQW72_10615 [Staphylococcus epidermidis]KAA9273516.1 hypothetical protein F6I12_11265 [Staphylococcus epidermidis]KAA9273996.1 hypothetical protein F6I14_05380 [Staphylococcus epidermidis]KAA9309004.1 hypothetical protein F6I04_05580 [Staphylococcus epidermidis]